jgi:predicted aspartyl protease
MPSYDASQYEPPAPVASVTLHHPDDAATFTDCLLLIDTGADVTLLPRAAVERIGIPQIANVQYLLAAFDGTQTTAPAAQVDMLFLNRVYRGRYVLIDAEQGVLGRDVLNHLRLFFDGPAQQWSQHSA